MTTLLFILIICCVAVWLGIAGVIHHERVERRKTLTVDPKQYLRDARKRDMLEWDKEFCRLSGTPEPNVGYPWAAPTVAELTHGEWVIKIKEYVAEDKKHG